MRTLTRAAVQRIMAMVAAFALAMIGLVSVVAAPAHAATDAAATLTVTEASEAAGLSVKVDGENFTDLPPAVGGPTSGGLYAAIVDRDLVIDDTPQGADVTLGAAYVANIQNGVFTTTVTAAADKLDKAKNYDVVTWSAHGNIASASLVTRDEITLTAAQKEALFPAPKTVDVSKPTISGTVKVGNTVTAKASSATSGAKVSYQWFKPTTDGKHWAKITNGGNKSTYTVPSALKGKKILVKATATKTGYASTSKNSSAKTIAK
ncbi:hypothetical protein [Galactobacter sp.]|uniref:hypothetical protein n=1 Tax=Galactobacter sp. TaxID=2676125 RepID=UPI0025BDA3A0|nr:hypothetical protein [Galactobacter sp.]